MKYQIVSLILKDGKRATYSGTVQIDENEAFLAVTGVEVATREMPEGYVFEKIPSLKKGVTP